MAGYIGNVPVPQATQTRDTFTATAGQTSFATSGYTPNFLDVYLNGVKLPAEDFTATNGTDVVLDTGAAADDILEVVAFSTFEVNGQVFTGGTEVKNAGTALEANRTGSDGTIVDLQKDGTTVGEIGCTTGAFQVTSSRNELNLGSRGSAQSYMDMTGGVAFSPFTGSDATGDLGRSSARFKDLYLSGGVYLGGTGSANHLDDYEEGMYTPVFTGSTSGSIGLVDGIDSLKYTKIGRQVTITGRVKFASSHNIVGTGLKMTLPFAQGSFSDQQDYGHGYVAAHGFNFSSTAKHLTAEFSPSLSYCVIMVVRDNQSWTFENGFGSNTYFGFQLIYDVA